MWNAVAVLTWARAARMRSRLACSSGPHSRPDIAPPRASLRGLSLTREGGVPFAGRRGKHEPCRRSGASLLTGGLNCLLVERGGDAEARSPHFVEHWSYRAEQAGVREPDHDQGSAHAGEAVPGRGLRE